MTPATSQGDFLRSQGACAPYQGLEHAWAVLDLLQEASRQADALARLHPQTSDLVAKLHATSCVAQEVTDWLEDVGEVAA